MQTYKCSVRMPSNFVQTIEVEAYTYNDAVAIAESSTGGKCLNATPQFSSQSNDSSSSDSGIDGAGVLVLAALAFIALFWKYILIIGGIAFMIWGLMMVFKSAD